MFQCLVNGKGEYLWKLHIFMFSSICGLSFGHGNVNIPPPHVYLVKLWKGFRVWFVGNVSSSIIFVFWPSLLVYLVVWFSIRELVVDNIIVSIGSKEDENNEEEHLLQMPEKC
jgi:hypothetical protein